MISIKNWTKHSFNEKRIKDFVLTVLKKEKISADADVNIFFIGESRMKKLNAQYMKHNAPTDVLSFPFDVSVDSEILGDIFICPTFIFKQKRTSFEIIYNKKLKNKDDEIYFVLCHGVLHLLGYTHDNARDKAAMFKKQFEYIRKEFGFKE